MCMGACTLKHFEKLNKACDFLRKGLWVFYVRIFFLPFTCFCHIEYLLFEDYWIFHAFFSESWDIVWGLSLLQIFAAGSFVSLKSFLSWLWCICRRAAWNTVETEYGMKLCWQTDLVALFSAFLSVFVVLSLSSQGFWGIMKLPWSVSVPCQTFLWLLNLVFFANRFLFLWNFLTLKWYTCGF